LLPLERLDAARLAQGPLCASHSIPVECEEI
jgi:hypothetical protein